jgi:hypothetical protein
MGLKQKKGIVHFHKSLPKQAGDYMCGSIFPGECAPLSSTTEAQNLQGRRLIGNQISKKTACKR